MKWSAAILTASLLVFCTAGTFTSQQRGAPGAGGPRPGLSVNIQELTNTLYISRIQTQVELTDDQYSKILPPLNKYLAENWQNAQRHTRALAQLRKAIQQNASEDEIKPLLQDLDKADSDKQASIARFYASADLLLTPMQQAKLRVFRENIETRLANMVREAAGWVAPVKPPIQAPSTTAAKPGPKPKLRN